MGCPAYRSLVVFAPIVLVAGWWVAGLVEDHLHQQAEQRQASPTLVPMLEVMMGLLRGAVEVVTVVARMPAHLLEGD